MLSISVLSVFRINFINLLTKIRNYFYTNALLLYFLFLQSIVFRIQMNRMRDYSSPTLFQGRIASHTPLSRTLPLHLLTLIFRKPFLFDYKTIPNEHSFL